ncbi:hypothetical protein [Pyrodictium abyssi]|uniref:Uncharacterized protein n=1 Tax=Pyrodictium abyssi TaxID=54256 RepID=A0ABM8IY00_9CREN|nr:hypothetical protein PABY_19880 [Pyrodictium abyssi]
MAERRELLEMLKRIEEKLYAGWNLYSALAFLYWIPVLGTYMAIASTSWFMGLSEDAKGLFSAAYWVAAVMLSFTFYRTLLKKYIERLIASLSSECSENCYREKRHCNLFSAVSWLLGFLLAPGIGAALEPLLGPERGQAAGLLAFITVGTLGVALAEYCASKKRPLSLVAPSATAAGMLLLPLVPPDVDAAYAFASSVIVVGYSVTAALYVLAALRRL